MATRTTTKGRRSRFPDLEDVDYLFVPTTKGDQRKNSMLPDSRATREKMLQDLLLHPMNNKLERLSLLTIFSQV